MSEPSFAAMLQTLSASVRSVGTAMTLASCGLYLHRRGFLGGEGKRTLALISQQMTFPLFLFTKILFCNQDWSSTKPCPDVTSSLRDVWILSLLPIYVVGMGLLVGRFVAWAAGTPKGHIRSVLAAVGFANSTGLPITLLTVVHQNFPETTDIGRIDPTLFLSVYLLLYPCLQWGLGGWLLAPDDSDDGTDDDKEDNHAANVQENTPIAGKEARPAHRRSSSSVEILMKSVRRTSAGVTKSMRRNILNNKEAGAFYNTHHHRRNLTSADEGLYISDADLPSLVQRWVEQQEGDQEEKGEHPHVDFIADDYRSGELAYQQQLKHSQQELAGLTGPLMTSPPGENTPLISPPRTAGAADIAPDTTKSCPTRLTSSFQHPSGSGGLSERSKAAVQYDTDSVWETVKNVLERCLQPPVIGAIAGIVCAVTPIRGILVDLEDRSSNAPLQWLFDGLYSVGLTAVPINMMILGCNLSASQMSLAKARRDGVSDDVKGGLLTTKTLVGVVVGKMCLMPMIGIFTSWLLKNYIWDVPDEIDGAFYLVFMIVFLTPTANNVMVMVELSGSDTKEGIALCIAYQYAVAPIILSITMTVAIGVASGWS